MSGQPAAGRTREAARVVELLKRSGTAAVLVMGEMGVGKSTLLEGATQQLAASMEPLRLHGSPALAKVPYGVLAPFLGALPPEEAGSRVEVLRAFWRAVEGLRRDREADLLLVIDDAHELDPASGEVVAQLVSARWTKALVAAPSGAALPQPLMELWLDGGVERIDLTPLTVHDVQDFLESALAGRVLPSVPRLFWQESQGNPLVLGRLVDEARRAGSLARRGDTWLLSGELPHRGVGLLGLARAQLGRLSPLERDALSLIVVAEPAPFELVERECGAEAIRRLVTTRLVLPPEGADGVLRLRHPVYGDALLQLIPYTKSLSLRRQATSYVTRQTATAEGLLRAVTWALDCGFTMDDSALLKAARLAIRLFENGLAVRAAEAVQNPESRSAAQDILGQVAYSRGQYAEAVRLLRPSARRDGVVRPSLVGCLVWIAARTALGHAPEAIREDVERLPGAGTRGVRDVLGLVVDALAGDGGRVVSGLAAWNAAARHSADRAGGVGDGRERGGADLTDSEPGEASVVGVVVRSIEAELLVASGRPSHAMEIMQDALFRAPDGGAASPYVQTFGAARLVMAALAAGEWEAAEDAVERLLVDSYAGLVFAGAAAETARGASQLRQGYFREAWSTLVPAVDALHDRDPQRVLPLAAALCAYAGARLGEHDAARALLDAAGAGIPAVPSLRPFVELFAAAAREALAGAGGDEPGPPAGADLRPGDAAAGDPGPAEASGLESAVAEASGGGRLDLELQAELLWFEAGHRDRLAQLLGAARRIDGVWAATAAAVASALADGTPEALLTAGESLRAAGAVRYARECFAEASRVLDRSLRRADARAAWGRKTECDTILGDDAPAQAPPDSKVLTRREREVVALAVAGLSDREIAERLTVSVRTVEGHLYRAYSKLDVTSREQLASAMGRPRRARPQTHADESEYTPRGTK